MHATGVSAVILPVNQIVSATESDENFKSRVESLLELTGDVPLGILETPGKTLSSGTMNKIAFFGLLISSFSYSGLDFIHDKIRSVH